MSSWVDDSVWWGWTLSLKDGEYFRQMMIVHSAKHVKRRRGGVRTRAEGYRCGVVGEGGGDPEMEVPKRAIL